MKRVLGWLLLGCWAVSGAMAGEFIDSQQARKDFADQLRVLFEDDKTISPEDLKQGLEAAETWSWKEPRKRRNKPMSPPDLYREARDGVVQLGALYRCKNKKCPFHVNIAGAYVIDDSGLVVTNHHVLDAADDRVAWGIRTYDGRVFPVTEVLASDPVNDVAVVRVEAEGLTALPLADGAEVGEAVYALHHPVGQLYVFTEGMVSSRSIRREKGQLLRELNITADFAKGSSGSPILNQRGEVVGMVRSTRSVYYHVKDGDPRNLQMVWKNCVPVEVIRERLGVE